VPRATKLIKRARHTAKPIRILTRPTTKRTARPTSRATRSTTIVRSTKGRPPARAPPTTTTIETISYRLY
jgi:hypothetical protein